MAIKVIVNGALGKMGQTTVNAISQDNDFTLVDQLSRNDDLSSAIAHHQADIVIDFTLPDCVFENTLTVIEAGARPVVGASGLTLDQIAQLNQLCQEKKRGAIIAPNFSIGAILMMRYAQEAAKYFSDVEIIEMHHPQKVDAPSGTAKKTAELIASTKEKKNTSAKIDQSLHNNAARGEHYHDIPVHSVRLTGYFASQKVIFGGPGEIFTLSHDAVDRNSMMPGVLFSCRKVMTLDHLVYGLDNIL